MMQRFPSRQPKDDSCRGLAPACLEVSTADRRHPTTVTDSDADQRCSGAASITNGSAQRKSVRPTGSRTSGCRHEHQLTLRRQAAQTARELAQFTRPWQITLPPTSTKNGWMATPSCRPECGNAQTSTSRQPPQNTKTQTRPNRTQTQTKLADATDGIIWNPKLSEIRP